MSSIRYFSSEEDLIRHYQRNPDEIYDEEDIGTQKQSKRSHKSKKDQQKAQESNIVGFNAPISDQKDILKLAIELRNMILSEFEKHPAMRSTWIRNGAMFSSAQFGFNDSKDIINDVTLTFNTDEGKMFKRSMPKTQGMHWSFMPILWEYGWSWDTRPNRGNKLATNNPRDQRYIANRRMMTYQYFEGTHAINTAISKFNSKYAAKGIYARFMIGDTHIDFIPKNRNIPYMRSDIDSLIKTGDW